VPALPLVIGARRITGVNLGSFRPSIDFDAYFRLYLRGRLPLDRLVSAKLPITDAASAFERAVRGEGLRVLMGPN
jgi:S-(hydroxymethyl)glutathione dehydrogenase/alcohol dehydrogenase